MEVDLLAATGRANDNDQRLAASIGTMTRLASTERQYARMPLGEFVARIRQPLELRQCHVFYNPVGQAIGFATWAFLSNEVFARCCETPVVLEPHQWNEGENAWIMDFVATPGALRSIARALRRHLTEADRVAYAIVQDAVRTVTIHELTR